LYYPDKNPVTEKLKQLLTKVLLAFEQHASVAVEQWHKDLYMYSWLRQTYRIQLGGVNEGRPHRVEEIVSQK